jgi:branched-chain amino acid transport system permease protein
VVLGGIGSITGSVIGAVAVTVLMEALRFLDGPLNFGLFELEGRPGMRMVVFSVMLMAVVLFRQRGLMGSREFSWNLFRRSAPPALAAEEGKHGVA